MRGFEWYEVDGGDIIVNVTEIDDIERVTNELAKHWTWTGIQGPEVFQDLADEYDEEMEATEWITLKGAARVLTAGPTPDPMSEVAA